MMVLPLPELAAALRAQAGAALPPEATGVSTDSRTVAAGDLFVALRGDVFDGHAFVAAALRAGAAAAVVDAQWASTAANAASLPRCLQVADTQAALTALGAWCREQRDVPVVAITGSNGKTTSKQLVAAALGVRGAVHCTRGNLNNHIGVPLTLARWPAEAWAAVIEMGMSAAGEIAALAGMARPDVGLVTCVAPAHLEGLKTIENVAAAKAELFAALGPSGIAIVNADDGPLLAAAARVLAQRATLRFGRTPGVDVQLLDARTVERGGGLGLLVQLEVEGHLYQDTLPLLGVHHGMNVAAATAVAWTLGVSPGEALQGMRDVQLPASRSALLALPALAARLIDDCYNANPGSVAAAVRTLAEVAGAGRSVAVLGDMLELGPTAPALHAAAGQQAAAAGISLLVAVGAHAEAMAAAARDAGARALAFSDVADAVNALPRMAQVGDTWLVKGSRGMRLERVVAALQRLTPP